MLTYQVGPGAGYFATIVYVGDDRSRATLTAVGNSVRYLPCLTPKGRASRGAGVMGFPHRVTAHDVRSFHPGQVRYAAELASSLCLYSVVEQVRLTARLRVRRKGQLP